MDTTSLSGDYLELRVQVFDVLRRFFYGMFDDIDQIAQLEPSLRLYSELASVDASLAERLCFVIASLCVSEDLAATLSIKHEYTRLFIGPYHLPAPPYESVYRSKKKLMMQDETLEVRSYYAKNGFSVANLNRIPDDSVALELEFMFAMSHKTLQAISNNDYSYALMLIEEQVGFYQNHLLEWIPSFCRDVIENTQIEFWADVCLFLTSFVERDSEYLQVIDFSGQAT